MNNAVDVFDSIADDAVNVGSLSARSFVVTDVGLQFPTAQQFRVQLDQEFNLALKSLNFEQARNH